jgi:effector-binding domain-containing protein
VITVPALTERPSAHYVAIDAIVSMDEIPAVAPQLFDEIFAWVEARGIDPTGESFIKYDVISMPDRLALQFGIHVPEPLDGDDRVHSGVIPEGVYGVVTHTGPHNELYDVTALIVGWAKERSIEWDATDTPEGHAFVSRLERYLVDPGDDADSANWQTEVAIKVAP